MQSQPTNIGFVTSVSLGVDHTVTQSLIFSVNFHLPSYVVLWNCEITIIIYKLDDTGLLNIPFEITVQS